MLDINAILDNSIIITPNNTKASILKSLDRKGSLKHIKYFTKEELIKGIGYSYDYNALVALHLNKNNEYTIGLQYLKPNGGFSYSNAKEILDNMNSLVTIDKDSKALGFKGVSDKTKDLIIIYMKLLRNDLITHDPLFIRSFDNVARVYIYGYSEDDLELKKILDGIGIEYTYIKDSITTGELPTVHIFNSIDDEVLYVFNDIMDRISKLNKDQELIREELNKTYIYSLPEEYIPIVRKYMRYYNLKINFNDPIYLAEAPIYLSFIERLRDNGYKVEDAYNELKDIIKLDRLDTLNSLADLLVNTSEVFNSFTNKEDYIELLSFLAGKKKLKRIHYNSELGSADSRSILNSDEHVYMLGFELGSYPIIKRDTGFYSDKERELLSLNTTKIENKIEEEALIKFISTTKNLTITFKRELGKNKYYLSALVDELNMNTDTPNLGLKRYSLDLIKYELGIDYDANDIYREDIRYSYKGLDRRSIGYRSYSNAFKYDKPIEINGDIELSATTLDSYYGCPFKYFCSKVLNLKGLGSSFEGNLGTYFHAVLEGSLNNYLENGIEVIDRASFDDLYNKLFKTAEEAFFVNKLYPQIEEVNKNNIELVKATSLKLIKLEEKINLELSKGNKLTGSIDKLMLDDDGNFIIIDYKTGHKYSFHEDRLPYGMNTQLILYAYMVLISIKAGGIVDSRGNKISKARLIGTYINNVLQNDEELKKAKGNPYALNGLTNPDPNAFSLIEGKITTESRFIKGLGYKKNALVGEFADDKHFNEMIDIVKDKLNEAYDLIRSGIKFDISPVIFGKRSSDTRDSVCKYCDYEDICYKKYKDYVFIDTKED